MERFRLACGLVLCLGAALAACWSAAAALAAESQSPAGPSAELNERRAEFIKSFKRIGLNTAPEDAQFLRILVEASQAQRGLEIGTATGYGAIHMGQGFELTGGRLTTVDIDRRMVEASRKNLAEIALDKTVEVVEGDALAVIPQLEGPFDFVFLDAVKGDYGKYLALVEPKLAPRAVIVADNVIQSAGAMGDFFDAVAKNPNYHSVTIRASDLKNDGMMVIYKVR